MLRRLLGFGPRNQEEERDISRTRLFGVPLADVMRRPTERGQIPAAVELMMRYVEDRCHEDGVFRKVGNQLAVEALQIAVDSGRIVDVADFDHCELVVHRRLRKWDRKNLRRLNRHRDEAVGIHTIASLLKSFFRLLPESLIEADPLEFGQIPEQKQFEYVRTIALEQAPANRALLFRILRVISLVESHSAKNRMTAQNLALVWAMYLIHPKSEDPMVLMEITPMMNQIVIIMILRFREIFPDDPPPVVYEKDEFVEGD